MRYATMAAAALLLVAGCAVLVPREPDLSIATSLSRFCAPASAEGKVLFAASPVINREADEAVRITGASFIDSSGIELVDVTAFAPSDKGVTSGGPGWGSIGEAEWGQGRVPPGGIYQLAIAARLSDPESARPGVAHGVRVTFESVTSGRTGTAEKQMRLEAVPPSMDCSDLRDNLEPSRD